MSFKDSMCFFPREVRPHFLMWPKFDVTSPKKCSIMSGIMSGTLLLLGFFWMVIFCSFGPAYIQENPGYNMPRKTPAMRLLFGNTLGGIQNSK